MGQWTTPTGLVLVSLIRSSSIPLGCSGYIHVCGPTVYEVPSSPQTGGGLPISSNRTRWPVGGGAVAFQPGWYTGHEHALIYINIGFGDVPQNYSVPLARFELVGPSDNPYPGTVCIPSIEVPAGFSVSAGDRATIQVVEAAVHGAALYSVGPPACPDALKSY